MKFASEETVFVTIIIAAIASLKGVTSQTPSPEWHRLDDAVYLVDNITLTGNDQAQSLCEGYGANLARVDSDEIQAKLTTLISPPLRARRCFWIGISRDTEVKGQFRWLDGTPVIYDGWTTGQPDNTDGAENCACLYSSSESGRHGKWNDLHCTADRNLICQKGIYNFYLTTTRTNPGFANVYCAVDVEIEGETLSPDNVTLSIGQNLSSSKPISYSLTSLDGEFRNNSFLLDDVNEDDQIFCYAGELPDKDGSFSLATFSPVLDFYALPELPSGPTVGEISPSSVTVFWSSWIPFMDAGDGPVVGYLIYQQTMEEEWLVAGRIDSGVGEGDIQPRMEFVLAELEPGTEYNISVSAVRQGPGGEGPRSPLVTVTTRTLESRHLKANTAAWMMVLLVISFLGNIILAIAMVILCKRKQKKEDMTRVRVDPGGAGDPQNHDYELPQPSAVRQHAYQGFRGMGISNIPEEVYSDIDDPEKSEYVDMSSGVRK